MKKKIIIFFLFLIFAAAAVLLIGMLRSGNEAPDEITDTTTADTTSSSVADSSATYTDADVSDKDAEEAEYYEQLEENEEKLEEDGNIYTSDSYQVFENYGYSIKDFELFDSYDEFINSEYCNADYLNEIYEQEALSVQHKVAYVSFELTNEGKSARRYLMGDVRIVCAENGVTSRQDANSDSIYMSRVDGWENIADESEWWYITVGAGETVTLEVAALCCCHNEDWSGFVDFDSIYTNPEYYLRIQLNMPNASGIVYQLEDDPSAVYIKCG